MFSFTTRYLRPLIAAIAISASALFSLQPSPANAVDDFPDFYATIVGIAPDKSTITVMPTRDQLIVVDVRELGSRPFDEGAFALDNVILLHTKRLDGRLVATGWEQARDGTEDTAFEGTQPKSNQQKEDKKNQMPR